MIANSVAQTIQEAPTPTTSSDSFARQQPRRRRKALAVVIAVTIVAGLVVAITDPFATNHPTNPKGVVDNAYPTSLRSVVRQDLVSQTTAVSATLGYAGSYNPANQAQGTITSLPSVGQVVHEGQVLYGVSGSPVVLLYGTTPAYRTLSEGATTTATSGADVKNLNYDLVALGYLTSAEIESAPSDFTSYTKAGVEKLQAALGVTQDGTLTLGQAVFLPTAVRVTNVTASLGSTAAPGQAILTGTSTTRQVTVNLDAAEQSDVAVGDTVAISLPNGTVTPGVVSSVGTVATTPSGGGSPTIVVEVTPTNPAATGTLDQAPVQVSITTATARNALVVPIDALLALSTGGYGVEVVDADGMHRLVDVSLGLFDTARGVVQVTGSGLAAGQRVVVPAL